MDSKFRFGFIVVAILSVFLFVVLVRERAVYSKTEVSLLAEANYVRQLVEGHEYTRVVAEGESADFLSYTMPIDNFSGSADFMDTFSKYDFIILYREQGCPTCLEPVIELLGKGDVRVCLIGFFELERELLAYTRTIKTKFPVFICNKQYQPLWLNNNDGVALVKIGEDFMLSAVFIPYKVLPSVTKLYIEGIKQKRATPQL